MRDDGLAARLEAAAAEMAARAGALDLAAAFPHDDIAFLSDAGALVAPFPRTLAGLGWGTEPFGRAGVLRGLLALGRGNLSVGRLYEAHVNAVRLLCRFAPPALTQQAASEAAEGALFGLWVTDPPPDQNRDPLVLTGGRLYGEKMFCSGAGIVHRAVVTAETDTGTYLLWAPADLARAAPLPLPLAGLRAARTGQVAFDDVPASDGALFGEPGAYLAEPDFSAGAWRTSALTAGAIAALVEEALRQIAARGRDGAPLQQERLGRAIIAAETASMWADGASQVAEDANLALSTDAILAEVGFARIAIEAAALEALTLVERSLGLAAFMVGNPVERMARDLRTYLRQPAPDAVLTEAAAHRIATLA